MPYLEFLFCEECGELSNLDVDYAGTVEKYLQEDRDNASINRALLLWDYLIYQCPLCGKSYKYTYRDVERRVREYLAESSERYREHFIEQGMDLSGIDLKKAVSEYEPKPRISKTKSRSEKRVLEMYTAKKG